MDETRMGLGTDQLELPQQLDAEMPVMPMLPPQPRSGSESHNEVGPIGAAGHNGHAELPDQAALAGLAPWAQSMQLPGIDT